MAGLLNGIGTLRESAYASAAEVLSALGFEERESRTWRGPLNATDGVRFNVRLEFPAEFPDQLPKVKVDFKEPQELLAHVDLYETVCISTDSGNLIDASRPGAIVRYVLEKAREVLSIRGKKRDKEILREVTSYWIDSADVYYSLCSPNRPSRRVEQVELKLMGEPQLIADDYEAAEKWANSCGWGFRRRREAYFMRLPLPLFPPPYKHVLTFKKLKASLIEVTPDAEVTALEAWIKSAGVPATVLLSMPLNEGERRAVVGLRVLEPTGKTLAAAQHGFRDGKAPRGLLFSRADDVNTARMSVNRLDADYMLHRSGANTDLQSKSVAVIGCGAVGSHVAHALAQSGVGTLRLIDDENLECGNVHRHFLGARFIGCSKARGLVTRLTEDYPRLMAFPFTSTVQDVLKHSPEAVTDNHAIVCALGDETLERRLNALLGDMVPRVHTWVEPHGIGGHVLTTGLPKLPGCYACLFERDENGALFNAASLTRSGQVLQKTLDGCLGTFTPYGASDAQIAAIHAARAVIRVVQGKQAANHLLSWMGESEDFLAQGLELSLRAEQFQAGVYQFNTTFARGDCEVCHA